MNEANKSQNKALKNSVEFKNAEQAKQVINDLYKQKQAEKESLIKQVNDLPSNYITAKKNLMEQANAKGKEIEDWSDFTDIVKNT